MCANGKEVFGMRGAGRWFRRQAIGNLCCLAIALGGSLPGCDSAGKDVRSDSDGKTRITQLLRLYKAYYDRNKKGPPDEQTLASLATS